MKNISILIYSIFAQEKVMEKFKISKSSLLLMGLFLLATTGCATNRGILNFVVPPKFAPKDGLPVKIVKVTDLRKFELAPTNRPFHH